MTPQNKAFMALVHSRRREFCDLLRRSNTSNFVYGSKHFFERIVERNLSADDAFHMIVPLIREFRQSTYNDRSYLVQWKNLGLAARICRGAVTDERRIMIKTIFDKYDETQFDVTIRI